MVIGYYMVRLSIIVIIDGITIIGKLRIFRSFIYEKFNLLLSFFFVKEILIYFSLLFYLLFTDNFYLFLFLSILS